VTAPRNTGILRSVSTAYSRAGASRQTPPGKHFRQSGKTITTTEISRWIYQSRFARILVMEIDLLITFLKTAKEN
jgi:hypothetical protein